jgi:RNA polymerase sigma factor (sigma-70 family)
MAATETLLAAASATSLSYVSPETRTVKNFQPPVAVSGVRMRRHVPMRRLCFQMVFSRRLRDYDVSRPLKPWLFGIAFRLASEDRRRGRSRVEVLGESFEAPDGAPSAVELLEADERRQLVLDCLQTLDLDQRAAMILVDIDGESPTEVGAALGIPLPTVYSRLRLGRTRFAAAVRRVKLRRGET